jgi:hypothetical protein
MEMDSGGKENAAAEKRERTQSNREPARQWVSPGVQAKKSGDSDLVHLIGFRVDNVDTTGHTGVKGMNSS